MCVDARVLLLVTLTSLWRGALATAGSPEVLSRLPELAAVVPAEAYEGVGAWVSGDHYVATGHSTAVDVLGAKKDERAERDWAELDAKRGILELAAAAEKDFDPETCEVKGQVRELRAAATYRVAGRPGLFLVGVVPKTSVRVKVVFSPRKARDAALHHFELGEYQAAARQLAMLSRRGVQDEGTVAYARAAAWHVNLEAGVEGESRASALAGLGQFYRKLGDNEASLDHFYELYRQSERPGRGLLRTLADLCRQTRRPRSAREFEEELHRRFPSVESKALTRDRDSGRTGDEAMGKEAGPAEPGGVRLRGVKDAEIDPPFAHVLAAEPLLLREEGARVVELDGRLYFVAVGATATRDDSAADRLRQLRVARADAARQAVAFAEGTEVVTEDKITEVTTIERDHDGPATATVVKRFDSTILAKVQSVLMSMREVGSWQSEDGGTFYLVLGRKLD